MIFHSNSYVFNSFPVPQNAWDKPGTTAGQRDRRDSEIRNRSDPFKLRLHLGRSGIKSYAGAAI
jgi:hypothetical protein